ncbi:hypothetical protein [Nannocystis radixulma]|uniref:Uncharacterized protein n=1 Tax=Nannocystis radixulma TaxID=2995305 RepID=A0ABT5B246_9BACT|nr:hypothetical protein [Nannocystis radixulma]MDC0668179.1 hypothetical protein [Nannocystis radixulma]
MTRLETSSPSGKEAAYLDRRQRLGFVPTFAFWTRPDIQKLTGPWLAVFVVLWSIVLSMFVMEWVPLWASGLLGGVGLVIFIALFERYLRFRLGSRALEKGELHPTIDSASPKPPRSGTDRHLREKHESGT